MATEPNISQLKKEKDASVESKDVCSMNKRVNNTTSFIM